MPTIQNISLASYSINDNKQVNFTSKKERKKQDPNYKPSTTKKVFGFIGGHYASAVVASMLTSPLIFGLLHFLKAYKELPFEEVNDAAHQMAKDAGLTKLNIMFVNKDNRQDLSKVVYNEITEGISKSPFAKFKISISEKLVSLMLKGFKTKSMPQADETSALKEFPIMDKALKFFSDMLAMMIEKGMNAFYLPGSNTAATAEHRASLIFHEIGHAINANSSHALKQYQALARRIPGWVALPVGLIALCHTHTKNKEGKEKSIFTKTEDFVKDNIGKITFLSFLPMVSEEALASGWGIKAVHKLMGTNKALKIAGIYAVALSSYIAAGAISAITVKVASSVRDKIVYPKYMRAENKKAA